MAYNLSGNLTIKGTLNAIGGLQINGVNVSTTASGSTGITWNTITSNTNAVSNNGYICNSSSVITLTLSFDVPAFIISELALL